MVSRRDRARDRRNGRNGRTAAWQRSLDPGSRDRLVQVGLPRLLRAARHELAIREAEGDLPPGQIDPNEVVDQALLEMLPRVTAHPTIDQALVAVQHRIPRILDAIVARLEREGAELREVEGDQQEIPDPAVAAFADRIESEVDDADLALEGAAIDDALILGRAVPPGDDPEDAAVDGELRRKLLRALFLLPPERRRMFEAVVMDGWRSEHVGATFGLTGDEVDHEIELSLLALVERLNEPDDSGEDVRRWYEALGERLRDEQAADYFSPGHAM